jgi:septum formation inhibitor-activating ATPase MinD
MSGMHVYTLADVKCGACRTKQALVQHPKCSNFYLLPTLNLADKGFADSAVEDIEGLFDYILCDKIALKSCNAALVVCDQYTPSLKCAASEATTLKDGGVRDVRVVINKANGGLTVDGLVMPPKEIATLLHLPLFAVIPEDLHLPLGKWRKTINYAFELAASNLVGRCNSIYSITPQYMGLNGYIKRKIRQRL